MITFSVTHFNLHCHCPLTLPPPPPIKWKPSRTLTTTSKRLSTSALLTRKRYFQGPKCGFTFGSERHLSWCLSKKKHPWGQFLEVPLDFHFIGAALLKTDSLTVMITFSVTHFNLHCHCPLTLPPPPPIKWKPSRTLTTTSKRLSTSALLTRKRYFQGPKCGFTFGSGLAPFKKRNLGDNFLEVVLDFHFIGAALLKSDSLTVLITYSFAVCFNILQYHTHLQYYCPLTPPLPLV